MSHPAESWETVAYDVTHALLALFYLGLLCVTIYSLYRLHKHSCLNQKWQYGFYALLCAGAAIRSVFFALQAPIMQDWLVLPNIWNLFLNQIPSLFFLSAYHIILYHWAQMYHSTKLARFTVPTSLLQTLFFSFDFSIYLIWFTLNIMNYALYSRSSSQQNVAMSTNWTEQTNSIFIAALYFFTSLAFFLYGFLVYRLFKNHVQIRNPSIEIRLIIVMTFVPFCFIIRTPIVIYGAFVDLSSHWWFDITYFTLLDIIPTGLLILVLHMKGNRDVKVSQLNGGGLTESEGFGQPTYYGYS